MAMFLGRCQSFVGIIRVFVANGGQRQWGSERLDQLRKGVIDATWARRVSGRHGFPSPGIN
jgi:hypothetical protein